MNTKNSQVFTLQTLQLSWGHRFKGCLPGHTGKKHLTWSCHSSPTQIWGCSCCPGPAGLCRELLGLALGNHIRHPGKGDLWEGHLSWGFSSPGLINPVVLQHNPNYCWNHMACSGWEVAEYFSSINPLVTSSTAPLKLYRTSLGFRWPLVLFSYPAFSACLLPSVAEQKGGKLPCSCFWTMINQLFEDLYSTLKKTMISP